MLTPIPTAPGAQDESKPPGQAPDLPAIDLGEEPDLKSPEELAKDLNVDGPAGEVDLPAGDALAIPEAAPFGEAGSLLDDPAPPGNPEPMLPEDAPMTDAEFAAKTLEFQKRVDDVLRKLIEAPTELKRFASEEGVEMKSTELFTQKDPPADMNIPAEVVAAIFKANISIDNGVIVPPSTSPKGFYIARITEVVEPGEQTLEQAKTKVEETLKKKEAAKKLEEAVKAAQEKLTAALAGGKSFADAAKEIELESREIPPFTLTKRPTGETNAQEIVDAIRTTTTGSVSEMVETGDNAMLVHVSKRVAAVDDGAAPDPDAPPMGDDKESLAIRMMSMARSSSSIMETWLMDRRATLELDRNPQVVFPPYYPFMRRGF